MFASLLFYGWWDIRFLPLLLASIAVNFFFGRSILAFHNRRTILLTVGVILNLVTLAYFKYMNFLVESLEFFAGHFLDVARVTLPIGISFFTFTQIAYLVDASRGKAGEYDPLNYGLFVTFFPHLIAGPILHHSEMMPQFARRDPSRVRSFALGLTLFSVGLFKKVAIADFAALYATPVFDAFDKGLGTTVRDAWIGSLAYTFQIYFDFSGYSDMAVGLAFMFGINFPINFFSPYKAQSIIDFWRRWHMTLSRFLRDYLYIPLGGNRVGRARRYLNLFLTMLLGGLWHGASWNFVIWGGLHGAFLAINHAFAGQLSRRIGHRAAALAGWAMTFLAVVVAWVFFRSPSFNGAISMLATMLGIQIGRQTESLPLDGADVWLAFCLAICVLMPNMYEILRDYYVGIIPPGYQLSTGSIIRWKPTILVGAVCGTIFVITIYLVLSLRTESPFLYFQF